MTSMRVLVADLLCGAGGSSTGCGRALAELGLGMDLVCVNHWPVAIETHARNHPTARHHVQDIATVRPHLVVPEGYLDLLMASPTCTHHSIARGGKPTSDQQRSDPWHVITWLTELRVKRIIIENVWEFTSWGPVDPETGKPIKARRGEYFKAWIDALRRIGFDVEWRKLNAADYGDATTRQRFILMGRSDGIPIQWPVPSHQRRGGKQIALFPTLKEWRGAREIIDWGITGASVYNRKRPLALKTLRRIEAGIIKFGWPAPFLETLRRHIAAVYGADADIQHDCNRSAPSANAEPFIISRQSEGAPRVVQEPMPMQTAVHSPVLVTSYYGASTSCSSGNEPLPTVTTKDRFGVVVPVTNRIGGAAPRGMNDPLPTMTTSKGGEFALASAGPEYDIRFRMLEPRELAAAMGFDTESQRYEFAGTKTDQIKQIGNAVSVAKMKACVAAIMADEAPAIPASHMEAA